MFYVVTPGEITLTQIFLFYVLLPFTKKIQSHQQDQTVQHQTFLKIFAVEFESVLKEKFCKLPNL